MKFLSEQEVDAFRKQGFLVVENFAAPEACDALVRRAAELIEQDQSDAERGIFSTKTQTQHSDEYFLSSGDKIRLFMEEEAGAGHRVNKIGHALHDLDPTFQDFSHNERLAGIAADIGFEQPLLMQSMYIFKQPRIGGEVSCHQDSTFLYTDPPSVVGFWFALQNATLENGCLWALPGGHQVGLKSRFYRNGKGGCEFETLDSEPLPTDGYVPLEVKKGTLVLLHGELPHYSEANRSNKPREAYTIHVVEGTAHYPETNWLQRDAKLPARGFQ